MSRQLILMRHAKSSWDDPRQDDFDRALNARGRSNAEAMGRWLAARGYRPDHVLVSAAARTRETCARVTAALGHSCTTTVLDSLYLASDNRILHALRKAEGQRLLLIAHNPGIGDFAMRFADRPVPHPEFSRYPTCATTVYELGCEDWRAAALGQNRVLDFAIPKEVEAGGD